MFGSGRSSIRPRPRHVRGPTRNASLGSAGRSSDDLGRDHHRRDVLSGHAAIHVPSPEPCFVDQGLKVAKTRSSKNDPPTYYPSYAKITPNQRRGFLQWMAEGRSDPEENLSLVFLFFYGLEHRIFKEGVTADAPQLIAEVERLLSIYGRSKSFLYYAEHFVAFARASIRNVGAPNLDFATIPQEMPLDAKIYLGRKLADGREIASRRRADLGGFVSGRMAQALARRPEGCLRALWRNRFMPAAFPPACGSKTERRIRAVYQPSSRSFEAQAQGNVRGTFRSRPRSIGPPAALKAWSTNAGTTAAPTRGSASRTEQSPLSAPLLLPAEVWIEERAPVEHLREPSRETRGRTFWSCPSSTSSRRRICRSASRPRRCWRCLRRMSEGLWNVGVGLEPDGFTPTPTSPFASNACLFKIPEPYAEADTRQAVNAARGSPSTSASSSAGPPTTTNPETRARRSPHRSPTASARTNSKGRASTLTRAWRRRRRSGSRACSESSPSLVGRNSGRPPRRPRLMAPRRRSGCRWK